MSDVPADHADWAQFLARAMDSLPQCFPDGALAYLTATSKVEGPVRNAIAYFIHQRVAEWGLRVAREYRIDGTSRDITVLDRTNTATLELEAKAMYSFDVIDSRDVFLKGEAWHGGDAKKLQAAVARGEACFLLSLVTHLMAHVPDELLSVIKYAGKRREHNDVLHRYNGSPEAMYEASQKWGQALAGEYKTPLAHVPHKLGDVYGIPIRLDCYLVGPLPVSPAG
jgi:hypothetical protein